MIQQPRALQIISLIFVVSLTLMLEICAAFTTTTTFTCRHVSSCFQQLQASPSTDEAAAITEFMARAHEEKIAAIGRVESKYREQMTELQQKVAELEAQAAQTTPTSGNSFAFPATNKDLANKVEAYRKFISDYIVKAQEEKYKAVKTAEEKLKAKYEAIIADLKKEKVDE